jgi:hypothetical protein
MAQLPAVPYFCCSTPNTGYFDMVEEVKTKTRANQLALLGDGDSHTMVFDSEGVVWSFILERPNKNLGILSKVLAQVYNPSREVNVFWTRCRDYQFDELRTAYLQAIELDDDSLTQFVERDGLVERVEKCADFQSLVEVWKWACTDHDID